MILEHIHQKNILISEILLADRTVQRHDAEKEFVSAKDHLQRIMPVIRPVNASVILCIDPFLIGNNVGLAIDHAAPTEHNTPAVINTFINIRQILIAVKENRPFQLLLLSRRSQIKVRTVKIDHRLDLFQKLLAHPVKIICRIYLINDTV